MRLVAVSDTHNRHADFTIPDADVFIHAGDFTRSGTDQEFAEFNDWLGELPHEHKIVVPGNHDTLAQSDPATARMLLSNATVLIHEEHVIDDVRFFGSPWVPRFGPFAFGYTRGAEALERWSSVPAGVRVLVTHGPPYGVLDFVPKRNVHAGCEQLIKRVLQVKPDLHIFGHIHEGRGEHYSDVTTFLNVAALDERYEPNWRPLTMVDL